MSGKKSGLNQKLRKLFAKIQREFDYPKVINVRCSIVTPIRTWQDDTRLVFHTVPAPSTSVHEIRTKIDINLHDGVIEQSECRRMTLMEEIQTQTHDVVCWNANETILHQPDLSPPRAKVVRPDIGVALPRVHRPDFVIQPPEIIETRLRPTLRIRMNMGLARALPMRLRLVPMKDISKKLNIRYRTTVFKLLNVKPNQVTFVGICPGIPPVPMRLLDVVTEKGNMFAEVRVTGPANREPGSRVWVVLQMVGKARYLTVTLNEE